MALLIQTTGGDEQMRTFSCFTTDRLHDVPSLSFIFAADEDRARELARREMMQVEQAVCVEVRENGRLVFVEAAPATQ